jgi:hypothetical protein
VVDGAGHMVNISYIFSRSRVWNMFFDVLCWLKSIYSSLFLVQVPFDQGKNAHAMLYQFIQGLFHPELNISTQKKENMWLSSLWRNSKELIRKQ